MSESVWLEMANSWGLQRQSIEEVVEGRVALVRWRHNAREFEDTALRAHTLCYMVEPGGSFLHRGGRRVPAPVQRGGIGFLPAGSYGRWEFADPIHVAHFYFPDHLVREMATAMGLSETVELHEFLHLEDTVLEALAFESVNALEHAPRSALYLDTLSIALVMRLIRRVAGRPQAPARPTGGLAGWQLRRVMDYMMADLAIDISLSEVAQLVGLSSFHFCRMFKQSTGMPPHRWRTARRLEQAAALLRHSRLSLLDIGAAVGLESPSHFASAFRKAYGMAPSTYRRLRFGD